MYLEEFPGTWTKSEENPIRNWLDEDDLDQMGFCGHLRVSEIKLEDGEEIGLLKPESW